MAENYDVVVLGGGTGGYVAALRATQLGLKTAVVEKEAVGGTCLHKGCIPTKSLLKSAEMYKEAQNLEQYGVLARNVTFNFEQMLARKQSIVDTLHGGVKNLLGKSHVTVYKGTGTILGPSIFSPLPGTISVMNGDEEPQMLIPNTIIIATGSKPRALPFLPFDGVQVLNSDHMLQQQELPTSILIIGAGVIGIEWASMLVDLGVAVTVVEAGATILATEDQDIQQEMHKQLQQRGVKIVTQATVNEETLIVADNVQLTTNGTIYEAQKVFVAIGREACTNGIGLENTDIKTDNGYIQVDANYQTAESHMYAIGDCIGGLQLAHVATAEGLAAVEHIKHKTPATIDAARIPKCIYSYPQMASIGMTEQQANREYEQIKTIKVPFQAIGKAHSNRMTDGFMKMIIDAKYEEIIGIHFIGKDVTELIAQGALAMTLHASVEELALTIHPHPTLSEVYVEAAMALQQKGIHI